MTAKSSKRIKRALWIAVITLVGFLALISYFIEHLGVTPRSLGPYVERRASGHNLAITSSGKWLGQTLTALDRGNYKPFVLPPTRIGAQHDAPSRELSAHENIVLVSTHDQVFKAISQAQPGDIITILPGTYRFKGHSIPASHAGTKNARIIVRAEQPGSVVLEFGMLEGFHVTAPYWTFENLVIRGICTEHSSCEHAFHVVGDARNFIARNNRIIDFNAHFKINGDGKNMPDDGLIEGNTLFNTEVRNTSNPVTPIDLVAASRWVMRSNLITDFVKGQGDRISYGAFAKGAGADNRFEQNIVLCESGLRGVEGQRVGLSLGGGGTGPEYCRDKRCITEQDGGVIQSNLIASCSDDGIYINRSATSKIIHNTLIDTGGIVVRFPESTADVEGNLVDGTIRSRQDGLLRGVDNYETPMTALYLGIHPIRGLYAKEWYLAFSWEGVAPRRDATYPAIFDLCGEKRGQQPAYGSFENFTACLKH